MYAIQQIALPITALIYKKKRMFLDKTTNNKTNPQQNSRGFYFYQTGILYYSFRIYNTINLVL
eukprot:UN07554